MSYLTTSPTLLSSKGGFPGPSCLYELLAAHAARTPHAVAIAAPGRQPLSYAALLHHVEATVLRLNALGIGRQDRVALVLPNGPELACAFLAVASGATAAPLNPAYRQSEFEFYLNDLQARALLVRTGGDAAARAAARACNIPVVEIMVGAAAAAGLFDLGGYVTGPQASPIFTGPQDTALVLHTSGTTARPKIVALSHRNLCYSARSIGMGLELTANDCCLNVMPLFHVHGLIGSVLASLTAGGSVVCTPGFQVDSFRTWLEEFTPTWYTAVPTILQAIVAAVGQRDARSKRGRLRFIRSCSAAAPPRLLAALEEEFGVPAVEAYGMTEAAHQMASNPLPPAARKPGSVGKPTGVEIAILDEAGRELPAPTVGEVAIRGENVMAGYENHPAANAAAFTRGWFRTGDQGYLDSDGYLFLTGRLKEIINRGGEKISPREIDEVLLAHPAVAEAVAFAVPHATLGETVAAAVVLRKDAQAGETDLRQFAGSRLADFKVPGRILFLDAIPRGPTGKVQRVNLAGQLGLTAGATPQAQDRSRAPAGDAVPLSPLQESLRTLWRQVLNLQQIALDDNFFERGGDSLSGLNLLAGIERTFGRRLTPALLMTAPTIAQQAEILAGSPGVELSTTLVPIQPRGTRPVLFLVHGIRGGLLHYHHLVRHLGPDQPVYGFQMVAERMSATPPTIHDLAAFYVQELRRFQPQGPYLLGGQSFGGLVAYEMAQQLTQQEQDVPLLALFDTRCAGHLRKVSAKGRLGFHLGNLRRLGLREQIRYTWTRVRALPVHLLWKVRALTDRALRRRQLAASVLPIDVALRLASQSYVARPYQGPVTLFRAEERLADDASEPCLGWDQVAPARLQVFAVSGNHTTLLHEPHVDFLAACLQGCLDKHRGTPKSQFDPSRPTRPELAQPRT